MEGGGDWLRRRATATSEAPRIGESVAEPARRANAVANVSRVRRVRAGERSRDAERSGDRLEDVLVLVTHHPVVFVAGFVVVDRSAGLVGAQSGGEQILDRLFAIDEFALFDELGYLHL